MGANRTTLVDNNTWNNSHIALVGKAMSSNESAAYEIMTELDVDYVLVIFGAVIGHKDFDLTYLEEAYTSEHWLVRVYRVKKPDEFNRPRIEARDREIRSKKPLSKKSNKRKRGVIKSRPTVIKGGRR